MNYSFLTVYVFTQVGEIFIYNYRFHLLKIKTRERNLCYGIYRLYSATQTDDSAVLPL